MSKGKNEFEDAWNKSLERNARTRWKPWHVVTLAVAGAAVAGMASITSCTGSTEQAAESPTERTVADAQACAAPAKIERDAMVARDAVLRRAPNAKADPIVNPSGETTPGDIEVMATVTPDVPLRRSCDADGWTRVRVVATGLRWMEGWVATSSMKSITLDKDGHRTLNASDIDWQKGSERDRAAIVKVANRIVREDKRCEALDNRSLLVEGSAGNRHYTLSCDGPAGSFPIAFTARDAGSRSFAVAAVDPDAPEAAPIGKSDAGVACMDAIRPKLSQPSSVDFHTFTDTTFSSDGPRSRFTVGFTAKNGFGNDIDSVAACTFDGGKILSAEVLPSGS